MTDRASSAQQDAPANPDVLIARIASGDRDAFAHLYREYRPDVFRFALHMCGSTALAEDVVQDVFLAVIESAARYQPGRAGVKPWLLGIASNHVRRWRHRRVFLPLPDEGSRDNRKIAAETDPVGDLTRVQHQAALSRAILALPVRYREAVVLCDLHELSYEAAAAGLGCAIGTIRSRLHRGRAALAKTLDGLKDDVVCRTPATRLPRRT
jgi:RNA polymerase sigma-70 factor (ECF subfamily)